MYVTICHCRQVAVEFRVKSSQFCQSQGQDYRLKPGLALKVRVRVNVQGQGYCLGLVLVLSVRISASDQFRVKVRMHQGQRSVRPRKTISSFEIYCMNRYLNQVNEWCLEREVEHFEKLAMSVILIFLPEIIFLVQNCLLLEMIISDNTERGSLKPTRCSCRKKCMKQKMYQQRNAEIQSKTYILS